MYRRTFLTGVYALPAIGTPETFGRTTINPPRNGGGPVLNLSEFEDPAHSAWRTMRKALAACREQRASRLVLPKRRYLFDDPSVLEGQRAHIEMEGIRDLVIDGQGSGLIFHHIRAGFRFRNCERLVIRNLTVDWDLNLASVGVVVEVPGLGSCIRIGEEYPITESTPTGAVTEFDIAAMRWKMNAAEIYYPKNVRLVAPQTIFSEDFNGRAPARNTLRPGMEVVVRHYLYEAIGFDFYGAGNSDLAFEDITLYRCPGHAWAGYGCDRGFRLSRCRIMRRPGTRSPITGCADGAHFGAIRGDILIEDCDFSVQGDDSVNIHGAWLRIEGRPSNGRELRLSSRWMRPEFVEPGAELHFHRQANLAEYGSASIIRSSSVPGGRACDVTIDRDLPGSFVAGDYVANRTRSSNRFIIQNNTFHDHRARGMLLQARDGLVENNRIRNVMAAAVQVTTDANYWQEGYGCQNLVLRRNHIEGCNYAKWERSAAGRHMACINVLVDAGGLGDYPLHRNITIEENTIRDTPGLAMLIASAENVAIRNNQIVDANTEPFENCGAGIDARAQGTIMVTRASSVKITGNQYSRTKPVHDAGIYVDQRNTRGITIKRNAGFTVGRSRL